MIAPKPSAGDVIKADVCVIGGGPAAIAVALELLNSSADVVMLVGGGERHESPAQRDLNRGIVPEPGSHEGLEENRRRVFGGASTVWGGRCIPFDPLDFKQREWIPHSGWPLAFSDLEGYYRRATERCHAGDAQYDVRHVFAGDPNEIVRGLEQKDLESHHLERWSPPINFAVEYREQLVRASRMRIFLDCDVQKLAMENSDAWVNVAQAISQGLRFEVRARKFVLATGGIENARILLASRGPHHPNGIGNDRDLVGRFYMCHPHGAYAALKLHEPREAKVNYERDREGVYIRRRWRLSEEVQGQLKIGNVVLYLDRPNQSQGHRDALFSCLYLAKSMLGAANAPGLAGKFRKLHSERSAAAEHLSIVMRDGLSLAPTLWRIARARFSKSRRLPSVLPSGQAPYWGLFFQAEQVPNPESRITLSEDEVDAHGMPRAVVHLKFSEIDQRTVIEAHRIFVRAFMAANAGELVFDEAGLKEYVSNFSRSFNSAAHHIGTTRMAADPNDGVVDSDCRVFDTNNLYVAGSSIFPTGGHANPTLTLVALAIRLGDHLRQCYR